ncbi:RA-domain-containing protein [Aaosphaeria arxii CBS 175.79]|uniref:RA-domain-containing protein n=1 Tax=Aaosphaeria arxii CBS 175.79 TaxID=1450172 RepID=A0A6A5XF45_9PLEO|nr:RA-domain-containing protein [Aaosphaeria arxii CBS 175.79]KAF2011437.1 RA-domain-containing protein [Aaosphaeria arxii CBS 175.79]
MATYRTPRDYSEDYEGDDEHERDLMSPTLPSEVGYDGETTDDEVASAEHTPTTFTHSRDGRGSPHDLITEWDERDTADFIAELGLEKHAQPFIEHGITGDVLIELQHAELKELGISSVGHRLTVLKAVYEIKVKQNLPIEPDHYVPLSADATAQEAPPSQDDFAKVIKVVQARDERIQVTESELRHLKDDLTRVMEDNRRLREELLSVVRMVKESHQPLPTPHEHVTSPPVEQARTGSSLSRKFSTKKLFLGSAPKNPSPTIHEGRTLVDNTSLDPSAAALAASSHLTASMSGGPQLSPSQPPQPSPTSPAYAQNQSRQYNPRNGHDYETNTWATDNTAASERSRDQRNTPAPLSSRQPLRNTAQSASTPDDPPLSGGSTLNSSSLQNPPLSANSNQQSTPNPQVEIFKSFRVSIDDPCHKVLPVALKKYNITADWRQYALYIVHGDQERCLGLNERPLILFKQLDKEGRKPMFMLRKHAAPAEGHVSTVGGNDIRSVAPSPGGFGWDSQSRGVQLPGGVL